MTDLLTIHQGDALKVLRTMPEESVQCVVTSPPYWGLRDYKVSGQIGLESTIEEYVAKMVAVFGEVRRVLRKDGTLWLNLGDSYNSYNGNRGKSKGLNKNHLEVMPRIKSGAGLSDYTLKSKDLIGIPWRVAFALQADGWYLRSDIIWHKPNPMPESVTDRPTKAHEYIFLMSKSARYYYDAKAIFEPVSDSMLKQIEEGYKGTGTKDYETAGVQNPSDVKARIIANRRKPTGWDTSSGEGGHGSFHKEGRRTDKQRGHSRRHAGFNDRWDQMTKEEQSSFGRNKRSVWTVATSPFTGWTKTVRWNRVSMDEVSCDNLHIASLDCPACGGLFDLLATVLCDGRADGDWRRIAGICDRLSLGPEDGFVPFDQLRAWNLLGQNLDYLILKCCGTASEHNTETRKTGLFVSTSLAYKPSVQRSSRIRDTLAQFGSSEQHLDNLLNSTWLDGFDDDHRPQTPYRIGGKCNLQASLTCGALYTKEITETSHFATFPPALIKPCILAGCPVGGVVLDPFFGSGTTGMVALELGRSCIGIELNPDYIELARTRCNVTPGLALG